MFAYRRRKFLEFFATKLAVLVCVKAVKHFHRIGRALGAPSLALGPTTAAPCLVAFGSLGTFAAFTATSGAGFGSFFLVELSVAIGVELLNHLLPHLGPLGFFVGCIFGSRRRWQKQGCRYEGQQGGNNSHGFFSLGRGW